MRRSRQTRNHHPYGNPQPQLKIVRSQPWGIYLHGKLIDTVFYDPDLDKNYVKKGLVNHDGYDPGIVVRRRKL